MRVRKVIGRVSTDGKSALNRGGGRQHGEADETGPARGSASPHVEIIQRNGEPEVREHYTDKEF